MEQIASAPSAWRKSRGTAILIALFLGGFGGHWFYLEQPKRGLLCLLFFWTFIPGLLALIDIIRWAFMDMHEWHRRYEVVFAPQQAN